MSDHPPAIIPRGIINAFWFQILNSVSWSIILGTTLLLYLMELKASGLVLGITVAMVPLFAVLQIPAAGYVERIGYKPFMVRGWTFRSIFILGAAAVPLLPEGVSNALRIRIVLLMLACFAAARGISMCGYMPWLTQLIPPAWRGRFIAIDALCINLSVAATMLLSSKLLKLFPYTTTYAALFGLSYLAAIGSLYFLKRIPSTPAPRASLIGSAQRQWFAMLGYPPFARLVVFNIAYNLIVAGFGVVWVPFMKDGIGASPALILNLSAFSSLIAMITALAIGPVADRTGSRPLLAFAAGLIILNQLAWWSIAANLAPRPVWMLFAVIMLGAIATTAYQIANSRLAMSIIPETQRSHFFAILSVANSLTLGLMPLIWGMIMDRLPPASVGRWNRFTLLYGFFIIGLILVQFFRRRLKEPQAMTAS